MVINYYYLIPALVLLWMPRHWLRLGRATARKLGLARRRREREIIRIRESGDNRVNFIEEFNKPRNYIDFSRALLGGLMLVGNSDWGVESCFRSGDVLAVASQATIIFVLQLTLIAIGAIRQFVRLEGRVTFYAPLFYFAGLAFALCGFGAGFFAFLLVWVFNSAFSIPPAGFLTVYSMLLLLLSMLFQGIVHYYTYAAVVLCLLPVLVSLLARRSLALFNKKIK